MAHRTVRTIAGLLALSAALLVSTGCSNAGEGLFSGAGIGAVAGLIIGSTVGAAGEGAAIGAAVGGATGAVIGDQNERNERYDRTEYEYLPADARYDDYGYRTTERRTRTSTRTYRSYEYTGPSYDYRRSYRYRCR